MPPVHVHFEGLISFVIRRNQGITVLDVLLPRVVKPVESQHNPFVILSPHFPCLRFNSRYPVSGLPTDSVIVERGGKSERIVFLREGAIGFQTGQLQTGVHPSVQPNVPEPGPGHEVPQAGEEHDYRWIAPMEKACDNGGEFDPDIIRAGAKGLISVRTQFREGKFVSREFSRDGDGEISVYKFPKVNEVEWRQALTEVAALETSTTNFLEVTGVNPDGTKLVIQPIPNDPNAMVVELLNTELEHLLLQRQFENQSDPEDFEVFFELVDRRPPRRPRSIPRRTRSAGDRICPMSRFG